MIGQLIFSDLTARGKTDAVARQWKAIADEFEVVCGQKEHYARADVIMYLNYLRERGLAQTTINKNLKAIRLVFQILGDGDDFPKLSLPKVSDSDVLRPAFTRDEIRHMISAGKRCLGTTELSCLAISTTYGLRRIELAACELSMKDEYIDIQAAKDGPLVRQLIPQEIMPYLSDLSTSTPDRLTRLFHSICIKTKVKISAEYGWHSIRRALTTELVLLETSTLNLMRFMRWSEATVRRTFGMLQVYAIKDQEMQERVDREIFKIHPFLPFWGE